MNKKNITPATGMVKGNLLYHIHSNCPQYTFNSVPALTMEHFIEPMRKNTVTPATGMVKNTITPAL